MTKPSDHESMYRVAVQMSIRTPVRPLYVRPAVGRGIGIPGSARYSGDGRRPPGTARAAGGRNAASHRGHSSAGAPSRKTLGFHGRLSGTPAGSVASIRLCPIIRPRRAGPERLQAGRAVQCATGGSSWLGYPFLCLTERSALVRKASSYSSQGKIGKAVGHGSISPRRWRKSQYPVKCAGRRMDASRSVAGERECLLPPRLETSTRVESGERRSSQQCGGNTAARPSRRRSNVRNCSCEE